MTGIEAHIQNAQATVDIRNKELGARLDLKLRTYAGELFAHDEDRGVVGWAWDWVADTFTPNEEGTGLSYSEKLQADQNRKNTTFSTKANSQIIPRVQMGNEIKKSYLESSANFKKRIATITDPIILSKAIAEEEEIYEQVKDIAENQLVESPTEAAVAVKALLNNPLYAALPPTPVAPASSTPTGTPTGGTGATAPASLAAGLSFDELVKKIETAAVANIAALTHNDPAELTKMKAAATAQLNGAISAIRANEVQSNADIQDILGKLEGEEAAAANKAIQATETNEIATLRGALKDPSKITSASVAKLASTLDSANSTLAESILPEAPTLSGKQLLTKYVGNDGAQAAVVGWDKAKHAARAGGGLLKDAFNTMSGSSFGQGILGLGAGALAAGAAWIFIQQTIGRIPGIGGFMAPVIGTVAALAAIVVVGSMAYGVLQGKGNALPNDANMAMNDTQDHDGKVAFSNPENGADAQLGTRAALDRTLVSGASDVAGISSALSHPELNDNINAVEPAALLERRALEPTIAATPATVA